LPRYFRHVPGDDGFLNASHFYYFCDDYFRRLLSWEKVIPAICKRESEVVAGAMFLVDQEFMEYHLSAATMAGKKMSATNLIIHEAALLGQKLGCRALHLGGGTDALPENPLLFFKSGFSGNRSSFRIGRAIHQPAAYDDLKQHWLDRHDVVPKRILFYRS